MSEELSRLGDFCREHPRPAVTVLEPSNPWERWRAIIAANTVPGDDREMIVTDPDLGAFVGKLEELFGPDG